MNRRYCNGMVHVIKPGDTLYQLSRYYRIPMAMLLRANPYVDVYNLQVGQEICIPMVRAHRGMICMPVPKDEPLPVRQRPKRRCSHRKRAARKSSKAKTQKMSRKKWQKNRQKHRKKKKSFLLKTLRARKKRKKCTSPMASKAWAKY